MLQSIKQTMQRGANRALRPFGFDLVRTAKKNHDWSDVRQYIPLQETLAGAQAAGVSVAEYIDVKHNVPGTTQNTHDRLVATGIFKDRIDRVCEVGPGSGRYLEKTIKACKPSHYEIYETAPDWTEYLVRTYQVIPRPTDGTTLAHTPSNSIDLFQAHKVFVCLLFLNTCSYFTEIVRVTRPGAWVVFDVMTEECITAADVPVWLKTGVNTRTYPAIIPKSFVVNFFTANGFKFVAGFLVPMNPGKTECMVFQKRNM
jgi:hypothetical protein